MNEEQSKLQIMVENINQQITSLKKERKKKVELVEVETSQEVKEVFLKRIKELDTEINELTLERSKSTMVGKQNAITKLKNLLKDGKTYAYIATEGKFLMIDNVSNSEKVVTLKESSLSVQRLPAYLNNIIQEPGFFILNSKNNPMGMSEDSYISTFQECDCSFNGRTSSYSKLNWDNSKIFNVLDVQRKYWAPLSSEKHNELFEDLIFSVSGGKKENIEHLEKWLAYKFIFPERNVNTPNLNITGIPGGNGKGILFEVMKSMFTKNGVGETSLKAISGGFNAIEEGKTVIVVDDPNEAKLPHAEIKNRTGSTSQLIERKGVDAYETDSTANYCIFDNVGTVKVVGGANGGEDRRWSIITTHIPLLDHLSSKYKVSYDQSIEMASYLADELAKNRIEVGKFIQHLITKYNIKEMKVLPPLHGEDYLERVEEQQDIFSGVFEVILPIMEHQGCIPNKFVNEIVCAYLKKDYNPKLIQTKFHDFLVRKGYLDVVTLNNEAKITFTLSGKAISFRGRSKHIDKNKKTFNYGTISSYPYKNNKSTITFDNLIVEDFNPDTFKEQLQADSSSPLDRMKEQFKIKGVN